MVFPRRRPVALVAAVGLIGALIAGPPAGAHPTGRTGPDVPIPVTATDDALTSNLDAVMAGSPADSCLVVVADGVDLYAHRADDLQVPASTQKLLTASTALDRIGPEHRYDTVLATNAPVVDGVVRGDVVLVGSGDPVLVSSLYQAVRQLPDSRPTTVLDGLADQLASQGITRIDGRVLGDESRYDAEREVPVWPARHAAEGQSGPLTALTVDDGSLLELTEDGVRTKRSADPPTDAAGSMTALLEAKGVDVVGEPATGLRGADATTLATVSSPPLGEIVTDMLLRSDNQTAELILKEIGVQLGGGGTTAAGAQAVSAWAADNGAGQPGTVIADGSGLATENQQTCRSLVEVLGAAGGPSGAMAQGLPVAGESGTLRNRFRETSANGVLTAKTGSLDDVSTLAGHVRLPEGGTATFAYMANGEPVTADVLRAQSFLAELLASYLPPCPDGPISPIVSPAAAQIAQIGALSAAPVGLATPGLTASLAVIEERSADLVDRCSARAERSTALGVS